MSVPTISIGLPVFNGENYVELAVRSILAQSYADFELIISDNGSTDATESICRRLAALDARIQFHRHETNRGAAWNYNFTVEVARGEYFKWQAHDDLCSPDFLQSCIEVFQAAADDVVLVYPRTVIIDDAGQPMPRLVAESIEATDAQPHKRLRLVLRRLNMACAVFGLMRTRVLRQTRMIDRFIASDYVLLAELALLGRLREVPRECFFRRVHARISTYANRDPSALLQWYDPTLLHYRGWMSPMMRLGVEYAASTWRLPLSPTQRVLCGATALWTWYVRELRNSVGRWKIRMRRAFAGAAT